MTNAEIVQHFVEWAWTFASGFVVVITFFILRRARRVCRDMRADLAAILSSGLPNGRASFAKQQAQEGAWIMRAHWCALVSHALWFGVGVYAVLHAEAPPPVGTPFIEVVGVPLILLAGQYIVLAMQICVVFVTNGQERWREESLMDRSGGARNRQSKERSGEG